MLAIMPALLSADDVQLEDAARLEHSVPFHL